MDVSAAHWVPVCLIAAAAATLTAAARRYPGRWVKPMAAALGFFVLGAEVLWWGYQIATGTRSVANAGLPLQVCDAATLVAAAALWIRRQVDVLDSTDAGDRRLHVSLEPAMTSGDRVVLERLVANLVDNAVPYNAPDGDLSAHHVHCGLTGHPGRREHRPRHRPAHPPRPLRAVPAIAGPHPE